MGWIDNLKKLFSKESSVRDSDSLNDIGFSRDSLESLEKRNKQDEPDVLDKTKTFVEGTVEEVKEQGAALWSELKQQAANIEASTRPFRESIQDKATGALDEVEEFIENTYQKAVKDEELQKQQHLDQDGDGLADQPIQFDKEDTVKSEQFFTKAKEWLDKQDGQIKPRPQQGIEPLELPDDPSEADEQKIN